MQLGTLFLIVYMSHPILFLTTLYNGRVAEGQDSSCREHLLHVSSSTLTLTSSQREDEKSGYRMPPQADP